MVKAREAGRSKTGYEDWAVEQLDRVLREETPKLGLWVGSSGQAPEQTAEEILARAWDEVAVDCWGCVRPATPDSAKQAPGFQFNRATDDLQDV